MRKKSMYESYVRIQKEAITITILTLILTLCSLLWSYYTYWKATSLTYIHNQGVTLQVFEDIDNEINMNNERAH